MLSERVAGAQRKVRLGSFERLPSALYAARCYAAQLGIEFNDVRP